MLLFGRRLEFAVVDVKKRILTECMFIEYSTVYIVIICVCA